MGHGSPWCHGADTARLGLSHEPPVSLSGAIKLQSHVALLCVHPEAPKWWFLGSFSWEQKVEEREEGGCSRSMLIHRGWMSGWHLMDIAMEREMEKQNCGAGRDFR